MKTLIKSGAILTVALGMALMPLTSVSAEPTEQDRGEVTFTFVFEAPTPGQLSGTVEGVFTLEGALFTDSGTATETYELTPVSETELIATGMKILEGERGTIVMTFSANLHNGGVNGEAQWQIIAGTGAYKKIRGSGAGEIELVFPPAAPPFLSAEYTGSLSKDPRL